MKYKKEILFYIPAALANKNAIGGQVTAAKGLLKYVTDQNLDFDLIDSANATGKKYIKRRIIIFLEFLKLIMFSLFFKYRVSIFFKSTVFGLLLRYFPAIILKIKGTKTSIFFRNSSILNASSIKISLARFFLKPYDVIFVQGSHLKSELIKLGFREEIIHIIPNWLSPTFINSKNYVNSNIQSEIVRFVFTGSIIEAKGVLKIIEAVENDSIPNKQYTLTFIGDGLLKNKLEKYCAQKKIYNINFLGTLQHQELIDELRMHSVLLLPSFSEGFPNSVLEALAIGKPVIVSGVGEIKDTVQDNYNGFIIDPYRSETILQAMYCYINDRKLVNLHSERAIQSVIDRHNWKHNCYKLLCALDIQTLS
ncbi:glycosyltransferase family 4 protein [Acinetobacter towneri]|uniref:glycosyltransferase family 4 protein n=1 Tax=Acinetobacter towneri TaxID=202956 RepID=UPI001444770F|nr:glycosyltransferase family 4 protein [Acinetobacter towneri]